MEKHNSSLSPQTSRRNFLKIVGAMGLSMGLGTAFLNKLNNAPVCHKISSSRILMGTVLNITLITPDRSSGMAAVEAAYEEMERLTTIFDHRLLSGPLGKLNTQGFLLKPPTELVNILTKAKHINRLTSGAFDITVKPVWDDYRLEKEISPQSGALINSNNIKVNPDLIRFMAPGMEVTLDGIAKGRVVDAGAAILKAYGFNNILIEAGGDLTAQGLRADGKPWNIGIRSPRKTEQPDTIATVSVSSQAVASSGDDMNAFSLDYSRNHILDPHNLASPAETSSASVVAQTAELADALSTALIVLGPANSLVLVESLPEVEAVLVGKDLQTYRSSGFRELESLS
jgi:FAD:protein FMN transferase